MRAVIWAAGKGTRLVPLTNKKQKCMIDIAGKPCLEYIVDWLNQYGFYEIIVKVNYKKEQIIEHFGNRVLYYYQSFLKEEDESLTEMSRWLWDDFTIVVNGDTLTEVNLHDMYRLSNNRNIRYMDNKDKEKYAGVKILTPNFWKGDRKFVNYHNIDKPWHDIGTWNGLKNARKYYETKKTTSNLQ